MNLKIIIGFFLDFLYNDIITHVPLQVVRKAFLRLFNKRVASSAKILMHSRFLHFWNIVISENVVINQFCLFDCRAHPIVIGNNTDIGPYTKIWTLGHDPNSQSHSTSGGAVTIGHHVWIASNVTILPNISIADGSVIGAASLVHKSTNHLDVVAGNPARFIRKRNNDLTYVLNYVSWFE